MPRESRIAQALAVALLTPRWRLHHKSGEPSSQHLEQKELATGLGCLGTRADQVDRPKVGSLGEEMSQVISRLTGPEPAGQGRHPSQC